jgi:large subunit ribosomal protein L25
MEQMTLTVEKRTALGKGQNRRLRTTGLVPGIFYTAEGGNVLVQVKEMPLSKLYSKVGQARIFQLELSLDGQTETKPSLIKDITYNPVKRNISHVDFYGVDMTKDIKVSVPVEVVGKAKGLVLGGVLEVYRESIEVVCKPDLIPDKIQLDVSEMEINDSIHIQQLALPDGVKAVFEDNYAVLGIEAPVAEPEPTATA